MIKGIWRRKWFVLAAAVVAFLSVGAVAWAAAANDDAAAGTTATTAVASPNADSLLAGLGDVLGDGSGTPAERAATGAKAIRQRGEKWLERQAALMAKLREDMSPADQALYDRLVAAFKEQREAVKQARQKLMETVKQLRELRNEYLDGATGTTN
jgi:hypothetical protein